MSRLWEVNVSGCDSFEEDEITHIDGPLSTKTKSSSMDSRLAIEDERVGGWGQEEEHRLLEV